MVGSSGACPGFFSPGVDSIVKVGRIFTAALGQKAEYLIFKKERLVMASVPYAPHEKFFSAGAETYYFEFYDRHI